MNQNTFANRILNMANVIIHLINFKIEPMLQEFNDDQSAFLNKEAGELVGLINAEPSKPEPPHEQEQSSLKDQGFSVTLSNVKNIKQSHQGSFKQDIDDMDYGFSPDNTKRFSKFVDRILAIENVKDLISGQFIADKTWIWLVDKKRNKTDQPFSEFILSEMKNSIREYEFRFSLINLNIVQPFNIGNVEFSYFSIEWLDIYVKTGLLLHPDKEDNFNAFRDRHKGQVFVSAVVKGEQNRAEAIAKVDCAFAMDIVKICSSTLDAPTHKLSFDIDSRAVENPSSHVVIFDLDDFDNTHEVIRNASYPLYLNKTELKRMDERMIGRFITFYGDIKTNLTELKRLIRQGIQRFASALSNKSYHQRVADLFTILESLLLLDSNTPIISNVSRYASLLLYKDKAEREAAVKFLKEMYGIRSAWVHHAKEKEIKVKDLKHLQRSVHYVLWVLIEKSRTKETKKELLDEIDAAVNDAIMNAYK